MKHAILQVHVLTLIFSLGPLTFAQLDLLSSCEGNCTEYGTCNPETKRCECPLLRHGLDCSIRYPDPATQCKAFSHSLQSCDSTSRLQCLNGCHRQGWCEGGFCLCKPGYYGADCSLSLGPDGRPELLAGQGYTPRRRGVKIYVYELPPMANTWVAINRIDRPVVHFLLQRLLSSGVRTTSGDEADYYFIPLHMRTRTHSIPYLTSTLHYIRRYWPWWDRHGGGHRHLLVAPGDHGRRLLPEPLLRATANCTYLTHWGLHTNHSVGNWVESHRAGKDIVVPSLNPPDDPIAYSPLHPTLRKRRKRTRVLFFAGRICGDSQAPKEGRCSDVRKDYSASTRQKVSEHHWNRTRWTITTHTQAYVEGLTTHTFCLAPTGGGYGRRSVQALIMGCIPVTITDGVHQPFEPEVDWSGFSVPVPEAEIPRMHEILSSYSKERIAQMQARLRCAAQHMYYSTTFGELMGEDGRYDAFETLMEVLRMRRDHPGLDPARYMEIDGQFADFVNCKLEPTGGPVPLCTQNRLVTEREELPCRAANSAASTRWMHTFYGWPGGAICGSNATVATCPRSWL